MNKVRDCRLDLLRGSAIFLIISAHLSPPELFMQLRNFDVPLLILISGASFRLSSAEQFVPFFQYFYSRLSRLLLPTWAFASVYFLFYFLNGVVSKAPFPFSPIQIIDAYLLSDRGIQYFWIVRVFIMVAISAVYLKKLRLRLNPKRYLICLITAYFIFEIYLYPLIKAGPLSFMTYLVPYTFVFGIGMVLADISLRTQKVLCALAFLFYFFEFTRVNFNGFLAGSFEIISTQQFKYPPQAYYLSYGLAISLLLYLSLRNLRIINAISPIMSFLNRYSLWIYLWHILMLDLVKHLNTTQGVHLNFIGRFFVVLSGAVALTLGQQMIIKRLILRLKHNEKIVWLLTKTFL